MAKREFLQLAHPFNPRKHGISGWLASEKLDGMRALWDGGLTRGHACAEVGWANTEKHARFVVPPISTGLWTRYGQPIHAPEWFLNGLPEGIILDGELYAGRNKFQHVVSATKKHEPIDSEWRDVNYVVFDCPRADQVFADGTINNTNFKKTFNGIVPWVYGGSGMRLIEPPPMPFESRYKWLRNLQPEHRGECWWPHDQVRLPMGTVQSQAKVEALLDDILAGGGEGLILKSPSDLWLPERTHNMVKVKNCQDAEGTVIGYVWGKKTDLGSKLLGLMGGLVLRQDNGKVLEISGFTDEERQMCFIADLPFLVLLIDGMFRRVAAAYTYGSEHPGKEVPAEYGNLKFPRGTRITYKYRELSDDGVAKEARYHRVHPNR